MVHVQLRMFSLLFFIHLALIAVPSSSMALNHFYNQIGFPLQSEVFSDEPLEVNIFSFRPADLNDDAVVATSAKRFSRGGTSKVSIAPRLPPMPAPYSSFYKNSEVFKVNPSDTGNGIQELAWKVSVLVNTLGEQRVAQSEWLRNESGLVKDCQSLAEDALLRPESLSELERLWAIGIWVSLQTGRIGNLDDKTEFLNSCNQQVYLEIQATLHYMPTITQAFDHWVNELHIPIKVQGGGLEECLKRAALIGKYEDVPGDHSSLTSRRIKMLVAEYLKGPERPQAEIVSRLLNQFGEIFKEIEFRTWGGEYTLDIFQHVLNYWSYYYIRSTLFQALNYQNPWAHLHTSRAKDDVIQLSEKLKDFLVKHKLNSESEDLYLILRHPEQKNTNFNSAIKKLLIELKTIPEEYLRYAYRFLMAHDFLGHSVEHQLLFEPSWAVVDGLQRAWDVVHPGFELGNVEVMDYHYHMLLKHPKFLTHAKWDAFIHSSQGASNHLGQPSNKSLWEKPSTPYDISNYNEDFFHKITRMMEDGEKELLYPMGLEMLMHLIDYLPRGPEYLRTVLKEDESAARVHDAFKYVTSNDHYMWRDRVGLSCSPMEIKELKHFAAVLGSLSHSYREKEWQGRALASIVTKPLKSLKQYMWFQQGEIPNKPKGRNESKHFSVEALNIWNEDQWRAKWKKRTSARMRIGRAVFVFAQASRESWAPFDKLFLEDM